MNSRIIDCGEIGESMDGILGLDDHGPDDVEWTRASGITRSTNDCGNSATQEARSLDHHSASGAAYGDSFGLVSYGGMVWQASLVARPLQPPTGAVFLFPTALLSDARGVEETETRAGLPRLADDSGG